MGAEWKAWRDGVTGAGMAKKMLTAGGIAKMKAGDARREIHDAGAPGLHLVIQTSGAKSWALRFRRPSGARAKLTLGPVNLVAQVGEPKIGAPLTLSAARALAAQINMDRANGVDVVAAQRVRRHLKRVAVREFGANTFGKAVRDFIKGHTVRKTGQRPRRWKETASLLGLRYPADGGEPTIIKGGLCAIGWADRPVAEISADDIYDAVEGARLGRKGAPSDSVGRRMADALGTMFGWLLNNRKIKVNPCVGVYRPPPPPSRHRVLSDDEVRELWHACEAIGAVPGQNTQPPWGALIKLLLLTGCRRNEIARLEDSELNDDMISLPGSRTKNGLPHDVPLSPLARGILAGVQRMPNCKYVFSTNGKTPVSGFSKIKKKIDKLIAEHMADNGALLQPIDPWRFHDLRRVASTGMNDIGIMPHIVEACLNHVSGAKASVAGVYNKAKYNREKREALEKWADHVRGIVK